MAYDHFAALVRDYRNGRSDRRIIQDSNIPPHWLSYYLRPGTTVSAMPDNNRIVALAKALRAPVDEVRHAFEQDLEGVSPYAALRGHDDDPQMQELLRLAEGLDTHHRGTLVSMARSLRTLQRRTTAIETRDIREVG